MAIRLPKLKKEFEWLCRADSQALQQSLQNLARAFDNFFAKRSKYPRLKSNATAGIRRARRVRPVARFATRCRSMFEHGRALIAASTTTVTITRQRISAMKVYGYWRAERSLLLVEGMSVLSQGEILGSRQFPLKLEAPSFRAE